MHFSIFFFPMVRWLSLCLLLSWSSLRECLSFRQVISRSAAPSKGGVVYRASSSLCSTAEDDNSGWLSRRRVNEILLASTGLSITAAGTYERTPQDYGLWGILPVGPYKRKKTIMDVVVDGKIWTFDQKFGILNGEHFPFSIFHFPLKNAGWLAHIVVLSRKI